MPKGRSVGCGVSRRPAGLIEAPVACYRSPVVYRELELICRTLSFTGVA